MKKNSLIWIYPLMILGFLLIFANSCSNGDESSKPSRKELLVSRQWMAFSEKTYGVARILPDCEKDDFIVFGTNGILTSNPGAMKCSSFDSIESGSWKLSSDEKRIIVTTKDAILEHIIVDLTENKFVISVKRKKGAETMELTMIAFLEAFNE